MEKFGRKITLIFLLAVAGIACLLSGFNTVKFRLVFYSMKFYFYVCLIFFTGNDANSFRVTWTLGNNRVIQHDFRVYHGTFPYRGEKCRARYVLANCETRWNRGTANNTIKTRAPFASFYNIWRIRCSGVRGCNSLTRNEGTYSGRNARRRSSASGGLVNGSCIL